MRILRRRWQSSTFLGVLMAFVIARPGAASGTIHAAAAAAAAHSSTPATSATAEAQIHRRVSRLASPFPGESSTGTHHYRP